MTQFLVFRPSSIASQLKSNKAQVMKNLRHLFDNNRAWVARMKASDPGFFEGLAGQQKPQYLWIGCSDSRVPANQIVDLMPGELFVHRNVANLVVHSDLNCHSVLQFAVEVLKVKHVIVCGHYGCGGVLAALNETRLGLIDNWLQHIGDVRNNHRELIDSLDDDVKKADLLCELNVIEQAKNLSNTGIIVDAWERGDQLSIHSWIYNVGEGLLKDLEMCVSNISEREDSYMKSLSNISSRNISQA